VGKKKKREEGKGEKISESSNSFRPTERREKTRGGKGGGEKGGREKRRTRGKVCENIATQKK